MNRWTWLEGDAGGANDSRMGSAMASTTGNFVTDVTCITVVIDHERVPPRSTAN